MEQKTKSHTLNGILWASSPKWMVFAVAAGLLSGVGYAVVIPFVLHSLAPASEGNAVFGFFSVPSSPSGLATLFFVNCLLILVAKSLALILVEVLAKGAAVEMRVRLYRKIQRLPIDRLEQLGPSKLINILSQDIPNLSKTMGTLPFIWVAAVTVVGLLGYLLMLDVLIFGFVTVCLVLGALTYQLPILAGVRVLNRSRDQHDTIQEGTRGLLYGAKELKLNGQKLQEFMDEALLNPEKKALRDDRVGNAILTAAVTYGDLISFFVIGVTAYLLPLVVSVSDAELYGIIMVLLYITGPVASILNYFPTLNVGKIALARVAELENEVEEAQGSPLPLPAWKKLTLFDVSYHYQGDHGEPGFGLDPIGAEFLRGQISFIVGGNGSGKSTLAKMISQHYLPSSGHVCLGSTVIDAQTRSAAREQISAIYSDFHTFPKLYGFNDSLSEQKTQSYLSYLELDQKIKIQDGVISQTDLSDGQKRRLALLTALLEDRDIYLFDEWAADQDPRFKDIFYRRILHDLKAKNKVVIVITHDDRYFECADQIVVMENGGVKENLKVPQNTAVTA